MLLNVKHCEKLREVILEDALIETRIVLFVNVLIKESCSRVVEESGCRLLDTERRKGQATGASSPSERRAHTTQPAGEVDRLA